MMDRFRLVAGGFYQHLRVPYGSTAKVFRYLSCEQHLNTFIKMFSGYSKRGYLLEQAGHHVPALYMYYANPDLLYQRSSH